jgi:hypothetical protein
MKKFSGTLIAALILILLLGYLLLFGGESRIRKRLKREFSRKLAKKKLTR